MPLASIGTAIWGFMKKIPDWVIWLVVAIIFLKFVDMRGYGRGKKDAEAKAKDDARRVDENILENSDDMVAQADRIRAANPVGADTGGELRDEAAGSWNYRD